MFCEPGVRSRLLLFYQVGRGRDVVVEIKWAGIGREGKRSGGKLKSKWGNGEGGLWKMLDGDI